jgi:hypothetical protein
MRSWCCRIVANENNAALNMRILKGIQTRKESLSSRKSGLDDDSDVVHVERECRQFEQPLILGGQDINGAFEMPSEEKNKTIVIG